MENLAFHLGLSRNQVAGIDIALLPGDPGRVPKIGQWLENVQALAQHREFCSLRGLYQGRQVLVCSTGIGGPSTAICVEELAMLGVRRFMRIGTCGAIQKHISPLDLIIPTGAVRLDGASRHIAPLEYPAVADFRLVQALLSGLQNAGYPHHLGICASSDTFYQGQSRQDTFREGYVHRGFAEQFAEMQALNVLCFEMEVATLFTQCAAYGLSAAAVLGVIVNRTSQEIPSEKTAQEGEKRVIAGALAAVTQL